MALEREAIIPHARHALIRHVMQEKAEGAGGRGLEHRA